MAKRQHTLRLLEWPFFDDSLGSREIRSLTQLTLDPVLKFDAMVSTNFLARCVAEVDQEE